MSSSAYAALDAAVALRFASIWLTIALISPNNFRIKLACNSIMCDAPKLVLVNKLDIAEV